MKANDKRVRGCQHPSFHAVKRDADCGELGRRPGWGGVPSGGGVGAHLQSLAPLPGLPPAAPAAPGWPSWSLTPLPHISHTSMPTLHAWVEHIPPTGMTSVQPMTRPSRTCLSWSHRWASWQSHVWEPVCALWGGSDTRGLALRAPQRPSCVRADGLEPAGALGGWTLPGSRQALPQRGVLLGVGEGVQKCG